LLRRHHIGFVFQDALLEPSMTVWQNLAESLPPSARLKPARERAAEALRGLALPDGLLDRKAIGLSGGQAQRVAVVRAVLKEPTLLLADEPTGNLDDATADVVLAALFAYGRSEGKTCVIVTHDLRIVERADVELRLG
jgi:ABC-type lipoprotein export system ATPase subunit